MRILHLVHQYPPDDIGGVELYTQTLAQHLTARRHDVSIFVPSQAVSLDQPVTAADDNVRVVRVPIGPRGPQAIFLSTFAQRAISQAWRAVLAQVKPEIVHVQHLMGLPVELIELLGRLGIPFVVTLHDYYYICSNALLLTNTRQTICAGPRRYVNCGQCALARAGLGRVKFLAPLVAPAMAARNLSLRPSLARAARLIAPSAFVQQYYCGHFGWPADRVKVIAPGLDVPPSLPTRTRSSADAPLQVTFIGGLAYQKGPHVLIDAVNQLPAHSVQLAVYGDLAAFPAYATELRQRARLANITFHGRIPHDQVWRVLADTDVLVVPSLSYESSSLISQEALAARVPVLASDLGALRETALKGGGLVFPAGDVGALRSLLQTLIDEPAQLARLRANITAPRAIADHVSEIESLYREVVSS